MRLFPIVLAAFVFAVPVRAQSLAITGVTVVDPSVAASRQAGMVNETVVIRNGHIVAAGPMATVPIPRGARVVDGRGKYLMPGLWDSHVHFMNTGPSALPLYVALGVTSVREMGGYLDSTRAWQSRMRAGALVGPRILTPGPILEAPSYLAGVRQRSIRDPRIGQRVLPYRVAVGNADDARRAIDSLVKLHVDFVKIRTTESPEAYFAILADARRAGLKVAGHRPSVVPLTIAVDSGQRDIEHALALLHLSADARDSIYLEFAKWGTWYTPTLVVTRAVGLPADSVKRAIFSEAAVRGDERQVFASRWLLEWWRMQVDERLADTTVVDPNNGRVLYESSVADVRRMHELACSCSPARMRGRCSSIRALRCTRSCACSWKTRASLRWRHSGARRWVPHASPDCRTRSAVLPLEWSPISCCSTPVHSPIFATLGAFRLSFRADVSLPARTLMRCS